MPKPTTVAIITSITPQIAAAEKLMIFVKIMVFLAIFDSFFAEILIFLLSIIHFWFLRLYILIRFLLVNSFAEI